MNPALLGALLAGLATVAPPPHPDQRPPRAAATDSTSYDRWHAGLRAARVDASMGADVHDLVLERDEGTLHLTQGRLHLLVPVQGRVYGAVFVGEGTFTLTPPIEVERAQMKRVYGDERFERDFRTAVIFFTDWTLDELGESVSWQPLEPPGDARREVEEALKYVSDDHGWVSRDVMVPLINRGAGIFYAHMARDRGDPFIFTVDPYAFEEVSLYRRADGKGQHRETVVRFHKHSDYATGTSVPQEALDLVRVDHYDVETTIRKNLDLTGRAALRLTLQAASHTWVPFSLHSDLTVDSIRWSDGSPAAFSRGKESDDVWVDVSAAPTDPAELTFYYHGDIMDRPQNLWVVMKTSSGWYPMHEYGRSASYRLTFRLPRDYDIATVGHLVSEETSDDVVTRVYETPEVRQVTFNIGDFESRVMPPVEGLALTVQVAQSAHANLSADLSLRAHVLLPEQRDMAGVVGADLRQSFAFFNQAFGRTPVSAFTASEIPYSHGEAFPGLVLLAWTTFQTTDRKGYDEMFRAHEVAHQWWGIGVRPATYHDRWMAEGFSEFSGIWYMARVRGSAELYQDRLKESREAILRRRDDAAPVWLGNRAATSEHPEDLQTVVYGKGAWVLHMLRIFLTDFDAVSEDAFERLMHDFYSGHLGQAVTTEQFMHDVEEHVGQSMQWFFDEWVYGSAVPTYTFSRRLEEQPDGQWKVFVRVRQEHVPEDFQMVVPILLDFGDAGTAVVKVLVRGPLTEAELPLLPMKPSKVEFNPFEAVLAETKTEGWKGS